MDWNKIQKLPENAVMNYSNLKSPKNEQVCRGLAFRPTKKKKKNTPIYPKHNFIPKAKNPVELILMIFVLPTLHIFMLFDLNTEYGYVCL